MNNQIVVSIFALFIVALAGCTDSGNEGNSKDNDTSTPPPLPPDSAMMELAFNAGEWVLVAEYGTEGPESGDVYGMNIRREFSYDGPAVLDSFEYECVGVVNDEGWAPLAMTGAYTNGGESAGIRSTEIDAWRTIRVADSSSSSSGLLLLQTKNDDPNWKIYVHDREGSRLTSDFQVSTNDALFANTAQGKFWCVVGPEAFSGGAYEVAPDSITIEGSTWSQRLENGLLMRLAIEAEQSEIQLVGPDGSKFGINQAGSFDLTFCSTISGDWVLEIGYIVGGGDVTMQMFALDVSWPGETCSEAWQNTLTF